MLLEGNKRFVSGQMTHLEQDVARRAELASGQKPKAIILSCSDSRVSPEIVFDQGLGEVFVVRTAGEVADPVALASIEYALEHLGSNLILVLGHTSCGAVKATLSTPEGKSAGSHNLDKLVSMIRPNLAITASTADNPTMLDPVKANVIGVSKSLAAHSEIISEMIHEKKAMLAQGVYDLASGKVELLQSPSTGH
jgi:carbonic anhydrase